MNSNDRCQIIRDRTGHYRVMSEEYLPQDEFGETSVGLGMSYQEACKLAGELMEAEEVMSS